MSGRAGLAALLAGALMSGALVGGALVLALPAAARAQDGLIHPGDRKKAPPPPPPTTTHAVAFPALEVFQRSRFWKPPRERLRRAGLTEDALTALDQELTVLRMNHELTIEAGREAQGDGRPEGEPLGAKAPEDLRLWMWQVPMVLDELRPLWDTLEWDAAQHQRALVAARFFGRQDGGRTLRFVEGKHAENQLQLEQLMAWFRVEAGKPERLALMLISDQDGPWPLDDAKAATKDAETATLDFEGGRRLALRHDGKLDGPWMLQLVEGKKALWTQALSRVPGDAELRFAGEPQAVGERGWVLSLDSGRAHTLHLDAKGQPLFYFSAW